MNFKNKKLLLFILLLSLQSVQMSANPQGDESKKSLNRMLYVGCGAAALSLGLFLGYQLGKFVRNNENSFPHSINISENVNTIVIHTPDHSINVTGDDNNNNKVRAYNPNYTSEVENARLIIYNNCYNAFTIPSDKMVLVRSQRGNVELRNIHSGLVNCEAGNINLYDIHCGIFGHTQAGNINVVDNKIHNNIRVVNLSTMAGEIYFRRHIGNQRRRKFSSRAYKNLGIVDGNLIGIVSTMRGTITIEEV